MPVINSRRQWAALLTLFGAPSFAAVAYGQADSRTATQTIIVTASPFTGEADRFATIVEHVDRSQILRSGGANLADALKDVPGVTGTGFAAGASRPVIRGMDANRVRILENGVGSFDVSDVGPDHGVPIDPLSAQAIEVVRGAATLRYGSQAIGGVVNAINNRVPLTLPDKPLTGEVTGTYGTNGDTAQGSALLDGRIGPFALHADGFIHHVNNYDTPLGPQSNSFFKGDGYSFGSSYFFDNHSRIGGAVIHYDARYGIPSDTTFIDMKQTKGVFGSSLAVNAGPLQTVTIDAGYGDYTHSEIDPEANTPLSTFNDKEWDTRAESVFGAMGPLTAAALGVQIQNRKFSALGEGADYLLPTVTKSEAGFAFAEAPIVKGLVLQLGTRVEAVSVSGTPASDQPTKRNFTPASGSVGLVLTVSQAVTLGVTISSAARAPSQTELFARGPHDGPGTFETGDPTLRAERANSVEGTFRYTRANTRIEGSAWAASFSNYIFGRLTGRTCDDGGNCVSDDSEELKELFYQQQDAHFWGVEAKAKIGIAKLKSGGLLAITALGSHVRAKFASGENVPRMPPYRLGGGLSWASDHFDADILATYSGRQNRVSVGETTTRDFVSLDSGITWRPSDAHPGFELSIVGHNLTNEVQRNAVALNKDDVVLPGRDVRLIIHGTF
jgi:iron complex outermembrane receptor protein